VCVLWVRSYWRLDSIEHATDLDRDLQQTYNKLSSEYGAVWLDHTVFQFSRPAGWTNFRPGLEVSSGYHPIHGSPLFAADHHYGFEFLGIIVADWGVEHEPPAGPWDWRMDGFLVGIRHWALVLSFAVLPAYRWRAAWRRRVRRQTGLCPSCGYDLRATPDRCPECGTAPGKPLPAQRG
jgi:hypothetical protein